MYDYVYRLGIAWQNVGYNQPPHLGYYLPDATAARFTPINTRAFHYVNCTGVKVVSITAPDGTVSDGLPDGITLEQDKKRCNYAFTGKASKQGQWQVTIASIGSGNGKETTETFIFDLGMTVGIEEIADHAQGTTNNTQQTGTVYDLQGRHVDTPAHNGVYITNGKKVVIK